MASWHEPRSVRTLAWRLFAAAWVGLAALIGILIVLAIIDWSGA